MKPKKKNLLLAAGALGLAALTLAFAVGDSVNAEESGGRVGGIKSKGIINYADGSVVIDTGDLIRLAGEIDTLEHDYKSETLAALNGIGTYLREDGSVTHQGSVASQPAQPTFSMLASAITDSQSSATGIADLSGDSYFKTKDGRLIKASSGEDTSGAEAIGLTAAAEDSLSAGAVAYVDGQLLLGTGADNSACYNAGYADGYAQMTDGLSIEYTYHVHTGEVGMDTIPDGYVYYSPDDPGGCFTAAGHEHNKTGNCPYHENKRTVTHNHYLSDQGWCPHCGRVEYCAPERGKDHDCSYHVTDTIYDCGSPNNVWKLGCGKTTEWIESATIVFP